jgi:hypothetical protein
MEIIFICVFLFALGWLARERWAIRQLKDMISDLEDEDDDKIYIIVDITDSEIFVYEKDTLQYLAHGKTENDITTILKQRFPGKTFAASAEDMIKLTSFTK